LTNENYKSFLITSRQIARYVSKTRGFHLKINEQDITPEFVGDVRINGYYFYDNVEKYAFLRTLSPFDHMILSVYFFDYVRDMTRQIL